MKNNVALLLLILLATGGTFWYHLQKSLYGRGFDIIMGHKDIINERLERVKRVCDKHNLTSSVPSQKWLRILCFPTVKVCTTYLRFALTYLYVFPSWFFQRILKRMSQHFFVLVVFLPSSQGSHYHMDENIHGKLPCPDMIYVMKTFLWCFRALPTKQLIRGMSIGFVIFIGTSTTFHQHTSIFQSNLLFLRLG